MIELRPHHLLCILTYSGKGYSPGFVANLDEVIARIDVAGRLKLVDGPDDICAGWTGPERHCNRKSVHQRDVQARQALKHEFGKPAEPGSVFVLSQETITRLRRAFRSGKARPACVGCEWFSLCSDIAESGFRDVRLIPPIQRGASRP